MLLGNSCGTVDCFKILGADAHADTLSDSNGDSNGDAHADAYDNQDTDTNSNGYTSLDRLLSLYLR